MAIEVVTGVTSTAEPDFLDFSVPVPTVIQGVSIQVSGSFFFGRLLLSDSAQGNFVELGSGAVPSGGRFCFDKPHLIVPSQVLRGELWGDDDGRTTIMAVDSQEAIPPDRS